MGRRYPERRAARAEVSRRAGGRRAVAVAGLARPGPVRPLARLAGCQRVCRLCSSVSSPGVLGLWQKSSAACPGSARSLRRWVGRRHLERGSAAGCGGAVGGGAPAVRSREAGTACAVTAVGAPSCWQGLGEVASPLVS